MKNTRASQLPLESLVALASLLSMLATFASASPALAKEGGNGGVGNGGGAWTCRSAPTPAQPKGELIWIELVDLSEGRREHGLRIPNHETPQLHDKDVETWVAETSAKIRQANPAFYELYDRHLRSVRSRLRVVYQSEFVHTRDIHFRTAPAASTCEGGILPQEPEQLANFAPTGQLLVNPELWNSPKLSTINRAALLVHETIYWMLRSQELGGDSDSVRTRLLVANLFSDRPVQDYAAEFPTPTPSSLTQDDRGQDGYFEPALGVFRETAAEMVDVEITDYDSLTRTLYVTERDGSEGGKRLSASVFSCSSPQNGSIACKMVDTNHSAKRKRGLHNYRLKFNSPKSFAWTTMREEGAPFVTRYNLLPAAGPAAQTLWLNAQQEQQRRHQQQQQQQQAQQRQGHGQKRYNQEKAQQEQN